MILHPMCAVFNPWEAQEEAHSWTFYPCANCRSLMCFKSAWEDCRNAEAAVLGFQEVSRTH